MGEMRSPFFLADISFPRVSKNFNERRFGCEMDNVEQIATIDWWYVFFAAVLFVVCIEFLWSLFDRLLFKKLGIETKKMREIRQSRELLEATTALAKTTAENLDKLQKRHCKDEEDFRNNLNNYMEESRKDRKALHDEMTVYSNNRINDRRQSLEIQKELQGSIAVRDMQINALVNANKEMLAEKINEKYKHYISINGIPSDEYDEFVNLHAAYKGVGGNHTGDAKFQYCIDHLPIIPVDTKLVFEHDKD